VIKTVREIGDRAITRTEAEKLKAGLELDLVAFYKIAEERALDLLDRAVKEGWSPDQVMAEASALFEGREKQ